MLHHTPFIPIKLGNINNKGIRNNTCRDNDRTIDFLAFPMLWKKFPITIGKAMIGKVAMTILMPSTEYLNNSSSLVKREHTNLGIVSPIRHPKLNVANASITAFFRASVTRSYCRAP